MVRWAPEVAGQLLILAHIPAHIPAHRDLPQAPLSPDQVLPGPPVVLAARWELAALWELVVLWELVALSLGQALGCHPVYQVIRRPTLNPDILLRGMGHTACRLMEVLGNLA